MIKRNQRLIMPTSLMTYKHYTLYLYTNALLGGSVCLSACPSMCVIDRAIETTLPLSNFKTKHKFGTLMALPKI